MRVEYSIEKDRVFDDLLTSLALAQRTSCTSKELAYTGYVCGVHRHFER